MIQFVEPVFTEDSYNLRFLRACYDIDIHTMRHPHTIIKKIVNLATKRNNCRMSDDLSTVKEPNHSVAAVSQLEVVTSFMHSKSPVLDFL